MLNNVHAENSSREDINLLLNELQVFQLKLEMQNEELKSSYQTLETERAKFAGLFDLAPVGYFILDYFGVVEEVNQAGVDLLNTSKNRIISKRFQSFIAVESYENFFSFLHKMQNGNGKQTMEVKMQLSPDQPLIYTRMEGIAVPHLLSSGAKYYITVIDISAHRRLTLEAENLRIDQNRMVLSATLTAQEKERERISRALHDSVCQILYGIRLNLQNTPLSKELKGTFKNINQLLDQAIRETRQISYELTPSVLKDFGFNAGIREMAQRCSTPRFHVKTNVGNSADELPSSLQLYLFRIIQELINNCIKHSNASSAEIRVYTDMDTVTLMVTDNGDGFNMDIDKVLKNGSGLRGIKNRVFLLDGDIDFISTHSGTIVSIKFSKNIDLSKIEGF